MPACFWMLLSVPIGISRTGCGTVTRPIFTGCLNCLWLPTCATSNQPSCFKRRMTSRLDIRYDTHFLHTYQVGVCRNTLSSGRLSNSSSPSPELLMPCSGMTISGTSVYQQRKEIGGHKGTLDEFWLPVCREDHSGEPAVAIVDGDVLSTRSPSRSRCFLDGVR